MSIPTQRPPAGPQASPELFSELQSEVSVEAAPLLQFIIKHVTLIVMALVIFVLVLLGTAAYKWYDARNSTQAQKELARLTLATQGAERVAALENFLVGAPDSIKAAVLTALANVSMEQKDFERAAKSYGQLASLDPQGALGLLAALNQGQALISAGKAAEAVPVLEKLVSLMPEQQRNVARQALAEAALNAGDSVKAGQLFEEMAKAVAGPEADFYQYRARTVQATASGKAAQ